MFNFTPLLGAQSASTASQSLLEFDGGIKVLVDVGWDEGFDAEKLKELEKQVPTISLILLTHPTIAHLGAFAHCCKHFPLFTRIPIYATIPVISLGRTLLQDLYSSNPLASSIIPKTVLSESSFSFAARRDGASSNILLQPPTAEEITAYFSRIHPLKYSQPHQPLASPFSPSLNGLTITAYSAGHTLGGTIWHIQHGLESIVYAVDWNQAREHVLSGAAWLGGGSTGGAEVIEQLRRPTAMVCSSRGLESVTAIARGRAKRDDTLLDMIRDAISKGGTVLIPTDSSARVLELAYLLEDAWQKDTNSSLRKARLALASRTGAATMRHVRSMLEWMDEGIQRDFESANAAQASQGHKRMRGQDNDGAKDGQQGQKAVRAPFDFQQLKILERKKQVSRLLLAEGPRVILASDSSLEWGFSREALRHICSDNRNLVILTERINAPQSSSSVGSLLWNLWLKTNTSRNQNELEKSTDTIVDVAGQEVEVHNYDFSPLGGDELPIYQQYLARQRQLQNTLQAEGGASLETSADIVDDRSSSTSSSSEDSDVEHQGKILNISAQLSHPRHKLGLSDQELGINILLRRKGVYDYDVRGKKGREKMFPYVAKRRRGDDFGEMIRPEEFLRAEEREEGQVEDVRDGTAKETAVGQKRKWDEATLTSRRQANGINKRRKTPDSPSGFEGGPVRGGMDTSGDFSDDESDVEDSEKIAEGPLKVTISTITIQLQCRVGFVDFSGLHDRRSLQMLIPLIRPRKLILVAGEEEETMTLATDCRNLLASGAADSGESTVDVFTPIVGMTVDASVDTNAWVVKLTQPLVHRFRWQKVRGLVVVALTGSLGPNATESTVVKEESDAESKPAQVTGKDGTSTSRDTASLPILDVVPASMATATRSVAQPLHVGDLRLAELRKLMQESGFTAEFRGEGTLVINGVVAVRKSGTGKIEVDGAGPSLLDPSRSNGTFYEVRRKIYEGLAVVAGG